MKSILKIGHKSITLVVGVSLFLSAGLHSPDAAAERPQLQILSADADADQGTIVIQGRFFVAANDNAAVVTLGGTNLIVANISETEIEATLPALLENGSHLLTVSRGNGLLQNDELLVDVGPAEVCPCYSSKFILDAWQFVFDVYSPDPEFEFDESCILAQDFSFMTLWAKTPFIPDPTIFSFYAIESFGVSTSFEGETSCSIHAALLAQPVINPGTLLFSSFPISANNISEGEKNVCVQNLTTAIQQLQLSCN